MSNWTTKAEDFINEIREGKIFSFTRWGDGEWTALLGRSRPRNCDGHPYSDKLTRDLRKSLTTKGPRLGIASCIADMFGRDATDLLANLGVHPDWYDANIFHTLQGECYEAGVRSPLVDLFKERQPESFQSVVIVGPHQYRDLGRLFPIDGFVEVPVLACFDSIDITQVHLLNQISLLPKPVLVSVSASMAANVLIHNVYHKVCQQAWLLDLGSVWLPYLKEGHGLRLRSGQRGKVPVL